MSRPVDSLGAKQSLAADPNWSEYTIPERLIAITGIVMSVTLSELFFPGEIFQLITDFEQDLVGVLVDIAPEIGFLALLIAIHEAIHYMATRVNGQSPEFGLRFQKTFWVLKEPVPYVVALEQRISRNENIFALIAPLVVINTLAVGVLLLPVPDVASHFARLTLVINTAGSVQDLYNVVRLLRFPKTADFVNLVDDEIRTFYTVQ